VYRAERVVAAAATAMVAADKKFDGCEGFKGMSSVRNGEKRAERRKRKRKKL